MRGISFVITYYKGQEYIFKCIDSIIHSHNLSNKTLPFEVIIMIDSMEDSDLIFLLLQDKYHRHPVRIYKNSSNLGVALSRNIGLKKINFIFFTVMDQDDYILECYFSTLEKELMSDTPIYILNGVFDFYRSKKQIPIFYFSPKFCLPNLLLQTTIIYTPGLLIFNKMFISNEKDIFIETSPDYKGADDWAAYLNLLVERNGLIKYKYISKKMFVYCLHENNFSNNIEQMLLSSISVINFIERTVIDDKIRKFVKRGKKRYEFLIAMKYKKLSFYELVTNFYQEIMYHFFISFFSLDRLNRLFYRVRIIFIS
jgi:glycosyltransferase involved in cell wall biosynthesis